MSDYIGIIDADLISRGNHRFPNLASMKISSYHKSIGDDVKLLTDYNSLDQYDKVYISKVFTDTSVPDEILGLDNVVIGGTGFYYDKAPPLQPEIEHRMPDYSLYDEWVQERIKAGAKHTELQGYTDYSIGFLTRGCFRQCKFCVNQNYKRVAKASPLSEFYDSSRKKILLLDDNFLGYSGWKEEMKELAKTGRRFIFKQGLDFRLLNDEKCAVLFTSKYDGRKFFSFDNYDDMEIMERKLKLVRKYTNEALRFYVFTGFDRENKWDYDFWVRDLFELFERIKFLGEYGCLPYITRFNRYKESPYKDIYINVARWCNQPSMFGKMTMLEFAELEHDKYGRKSNIRAVKNLMENEPQMTDYLTNVKYKRAG